MAPAERPRVAAAAQAYAAAHPAPAPQASDPAAVVDAYLAGGGNPEAQLKMVTDDFTIRIVPPPPGTLGVWSGKAQAAGYFAFAKSQNPRVQRVGAWQVSGANVAGTVLVTVNDFLKWNIGAVQHQYEFVVQDGKIKSLTATMAPAERPRVQAAAQAYAAAHPAPAPPGMPTTGQPQDAAPLLVAMGLLLLALGATFRRRRV
jgi:MYXO-CTERM domain-containing protein